MKVPTMLLAGLLVPGFAAAQQGAPPLGLHILMGVSTPQRIANVVSALERGVIAPIEIIARAI